MITCPDCGCSFDASKRLKDILEQAPRIMEGSPSVAILAINGTPRECLIAPGRPHRLCEKGTVGCIVRHAHLVSQVR